MLARALLVVLVLSLAATFPAPQSHGAASGIPTSIGLLYPKKKLFKSGDWVFYRVEGENLSGEKSLDFQRVQIGVTLAYRGEDCFWVETGWGQSPDTLRWSAAMVSENLFQDELGDIRANLYLRRLHTSTDANGIPRASEVRTMDPKKGPPDMSQFRPTYTEGGVETLQTAKGPIPCQVVEMKRTYWASRDMADSTLQQRTEITAKRWLSLDRIPITGLVREEERQVFTQRTWPLGKPSTDFPWQMVGVDVTRTELLDYGHGAKPHLSHRMRDAREPHASMAE